MCYQTSHVMVHLFILVGLPNSSVNLCQKLKLNLLSCFATHEFDGSAVVKVSRDFFDLGTKIDIFLNEKNQPQM